MKKIFTSILLLSLIACGSSSTNTPTTKDTVATSTEGVQTPATAGNDFFDTAKWKKLDLKQYNDIPFAISVPAAATARKSLNNDAGVQVMFGDTYFFFYEIGEETSYTDVAEMLKDRKISTPSDYQNFKIEKENADGFIFSYTADGKTSRSFVAAKKINGKVYSVSLAGTSGELTPEQIQKLYDGINS